MSAGELGLIDAFLRPFGADRHRRGSAAAGVVIGPGDDCASVQPSRGVRVVLTTDAVIEGVHFDLRRGSPEDAGHKALAVNLSDLAAAGARPRWCLCALGVPRSKGPEAIAVGFAAGMAALAARHGVALVGGNVSRAAQWSITITAAGEARRPLSRAGGRPGDLLVVCGTLGSAALGLRELQAGKRTASTRAQLRPEPLVAAGLAAAGIASAAIDVSDGLLRDLRHLASASACGGRVDCDALPASAAVRRASPDRLLELTGGEDYALLFAVRPRRTVALIEALAHAGAPAAVIGALTAGSKLELIERGRARPLPARLGWDHLA